MKTPTTECQQYTQTTTQINREFLISQGWILKEEKPFFDAYYHSKDNNAVCSINTYGVFSIHILHCCNKTLEAGFVGKTTNMEDYFAILRLLKLRKLIVE